MKAERTVIDSNFTEEYYWLAGDFFSVKSDVLFYMKMHNCWDSMLYNPSFDTEPSLVSSLFQFVILLLSQ